MSISAGGPFKLSGALAPKRFKRLGPLLESAVERLLALHHLDRLYRQLPPSENVDEFLERVLDVFSIRYETCCLRLTDIPGSGGLVVVCNHPFGAIEGVILAHLLRRRRPDIRVMANHYLGRIPELKELFIAVDPFGGPGSRQRNLAPMRSAIRWVREGGVLVVFPAGEVSHVNLRAGRITDPEWNSNIGRLIRMSGTPVLPVFIAGSNSRLFQLAGMLHPRLRTALLPRELANKQDCTVRIHIGEPVPVDDYSLHREDSTLIDYLRFRTYLLRETRSRSSDLAGTPLPRRIHARPLASARDTGEIAGEIARLPREQHLLQQGSLQVFWAHAFQLDAALHEIGRLRELTFRAVGEGTGRALDLDAFDEYYLHLIAWDTASSQIIGAYRMGQVDRIMERYGRRGLYTYTLFDYPAAFISRIEPAIELGRSFIRPEWQRNYASLLLLWKGIGRFITRHPRYRVLFGPVSISDEYHSMSLKLMVDFLRDNNFPRDIAHQVRPRSRLRNAAGKLPGDLRLPKLNGFDGLCNLVSLIEGHERSVPVLLKQYLKMGGQVLGFNVDREFGDCVDALLMVDLPSTPARVLARYMGRDEAGNYLNHHLQTIYRKAG